MCFCLFGMVKKRPEIFAKTHEIFFLSIKKDDQQKWYKTIDLVIFLSFKLNFFYRFFKKSSFA
jgi:hypothetical protein